MSKILRINVFLLKSNLCFSFSHCFDSFLLELGFFFQLFIFFYLISFPSFITKKYRIWKQYKQIDNLYFYFPRFAVFSFLSCSIKPESSALSTVKKRSRKKGSCRKKYSKIKLKKKKKKVCSSL